MKLRQGRRVGRTLYHQQGPEPSEDDPIIGMVDTPELAATILAADFRRYNGTNNGPVSPPVDPISVPRGHIEGGETRDE